MMNKESPPSLVHRVVRTGQDGHLRAEEMLLPQCWSIAMLFLTELSANGRDCVAAADGNRMGPRERASADLHGIPRDELFRVWKDVVRAKGLAVPNPASALEGALMIREHEGTLLSLGNFLFLDVVLLARVLEPVLNHKGVEERGGARMFGDVELKEQWQEYALQRLAKEGILEARFAAFLWPRMTDHVLDALKHIGLTFPHPDEDGALVIPLRLPDTRPLHVGQMLANFRDDKQVSLTMHWKMPLGVPPGDVERIISRCAHLGVASQFWRFGVLVRVGKAENSDGAIQSWLMLEYNPYEKELAVTAWGDLTGTTPWAIVSYVCAVIRDMTLACPGLRWTAFLGCPDHPGETMKISEARRRGDCLVEEKHTCRLCRLSGKGAGLLVPALLVPAILEVDDGAGPAHGPSSDDQILTKLNEILRSIQGPGQGTIAEEDSSTLAASLRNLRSQLGKDTRDIIEESERRVTNVAGKVEEALTKMASDQSDAMRQLRGELARLTDPIPRHAVLLPPREDESKELTEEQREVSSWDQRLREWLGKGKQAGKGFARKEVRLFFLCGHDNSLAECGLDGKGYVIKCPRTWVKTVLPALLVIVNIALKHAVGLCIDGQSFASVLSSTVQDAAYAGTDRGFSAVAERFDDPSGNADNLEQRGLGNDPHSMGSSNASQKPSSREAEEALQELVRKITREGLQENADGRFLCFDTTLQLVDKAGQGAEWTWGSTSSTELACGSGYLYCPEGSGAPVNVSVGWYATGGGELTRTIQAECYAGTGGGGKTPPSGFEIIEQCPDNTVGWMRPLSLWFR